jgi:hypothetical protein
MYHALFAAGSRNRKNDVYYAESTREVPSRPTQKYPASISRLAVVTSQGALPLFECTTNPTADEFQRLLEKVLPQIARLLGHEYVLLHDRSPAWTAASTQDYLADHCPAFFSKHDYPSNSPDCNLVENIIGHVKSLVNKARPRNKTELIRAVNEAWTTATTPDRLASLYESMPQRMAAITAAKGGNTRY